VYTRYKGVWGCEWLEWSFWRPHLAPVFSQPALFSVSVCPPTQDYQWQPKPVVVHKSTGHTILEPGEPIPPRMIMQPYHPDTQIMWPHWSSNPAHVGYCCQVVRTVMLPLVPPVQATYFISFILCVSCLQCIRIVWSAVKTSWTLYSRHKIICWLFAVLC